MRLFGYPIETRSVLVGAVLALAISVPVAALLLVLVDDDSWVNVFAVVVAGFGFAVGGYWAGWHEPRTPAIHGAAAAAVAVAGLVAIRIARRVVSGDDMVWGSIVVSVLLAVWLGAGGGILGSRRAVRDHTDGGDQAGPIARRDPR